MVDRALQSGAAALADRRSGQKSLFGDMEEEEESATEAALPDIPEIEERERLAMEKEVLGFYLTSHPLAEYQKALSTFCSHTTLSLSEMPHRSEVIVGGMIGSIKMAHVRKVRPGATATKYANFDLEDMHGVVRCILWPDDFLKCGELVKPDAILLIRGVVDKRGGDEANLVCNELIPMDQLDARYTSGVVIRIDQKLHGEDVLAKVKEIVRGYPGNRDLELLLNLEDGSRVHLKSQRMKLEITPELQTAGRRPVGRRLLPPHHHASQTVGQRQWEWPSKG